MKNHLIISFVIFICQYTFGQNEILDSFVKDYAKEHQFNGTILVQKDSNILYHKSFGIAERRFNIPTTNETAYKIASITKAFASILILQLYDEGKLDLHKTFNEYLPEFKGEASSKVTIHQLLNHTSGLRQIDTISSLNNAFKYGLGYLQKPNTSDQLLHLFEKDSLVNIPGKKWDYNNYEYMIMGKIVEKLRNKPWEDVLIEKILLPLEMKNTGVLHTENIVPNLASTYFVGNDPEKLMPDLPVYMENWYAEGSLYSCTNDLIKLSNALFGLKLIKKETLNLMLTPELEEFGYGVWIRGRGDMKVMERFGSIMGANSIWTQFLNKDITVILLSNTNLTDLGKFAISVGKKVMNKE